MKQWLYFKVVSRFRDRVLIQSSCSLFSVQTLYHRIVVKRYCRRTFLPFSHFCPLIKPVVRIQPSHKLLRDPFTPRASHPLGGLSALHPGPGPVPEPSGWWLIVRHFFPHLSLPPHHFPKESTSYCFTGSC